MEIALLAKSGLRIKGKRATFAVDPQEKSSYEAVLLLNKSVDEIANTEDAVVIGGHGEYEIGGIKMSGIRVGTDIIYSMNVDGVNILLGNLSALEKMQSKLQEHDIVVASCISSNSASFITSLAKNVIMFYGEKAAEVAMGFGKESVKTINKYSSTKDKLPAEVETILLANS
jgi:hypothetical protein